MESRTRYPLWETALRTINSMQSEQQLFQGPPTSAGTQETSEGMSEVARRAEEFNVQGYEKLKDGRFSEAVGFFSEGIRLEGVPLKLLGTLYSNRSAAFLETDNFTLAKYDAKICITLRPTWFGGYARLGQAHEKMWRNAKATQYYNFAIYWVDMSLKTSTNPEDSVDYSKKLRLRHRNLLNQTVLRTGNTAPSEKFTLTLGSFQATSAAVDLLGLTEIFLKDMEESREDKVHTGRVLKVAVVEDAVLGNPWVGLLVVDGNGDIARVFVSNFPQKKTQEKIGYGTQLSLIHPQYATMDDGLRGLRVDDPQLIFQHAHLWNPNRCRYCWKTEEADTETCTKCGRASYCSKLCLQKDARELNHSAVCFKTKDSECVIA